MPVFVFLVFLGGLLLWLLLSFVFIPLGKFVSRLLSDAKEAMNYETKNESEMKE